MNISVGNQSTMASPLSDNRVTLMYSIVGGGTGAMFVLVVCLLCIYFWVRRWCLGRHVLPIDFRASSHLIDDDLEAALADLYFSGSHLTEDGDVQTNLSSLPGDYNC